MMRGVDPLARLGVVLIAFLVLVGCGDDGGEGGGTGAAPTTTTESAPAPEGGPPVRRPGGLSGEAAEAADVVVEFLEQPSGEDACFALVGTEYADSLGGQEACARRFDPLVTGRYDTIASVRVVKPGVEAAAEVTSSQGGGRVTLKLAMATTGWRVDGASGLPG